MRDRDAPGRRVEDGSRGRSISSKRSGSTSSFAGIDESGGRAFIPLGEVAPSRWAAITAITAITAIAACVASEPPTLTEAASNAWGEALNRLSAPRFDSVV